MMSEIEEASLYYAYAAQLERFDANYLAKLESLEAHFAVAFRAPDGPPYAQFVAARTALEADLRTRYATAAADYRTARSALARRIIS